jgi:hypothetical protein
MGGLVCMGERASIMQDRLVHAARLERMHLAKKLESIVCLKRIFYPRAERHRGRRHHGAPCCGPAPWVTKMMKERQPQRAKCNSHSHLVFKVACVSSSLPSDTACNAINSNDHAVAAYEYADNAYIGCVK